MASPIVILAFTVIALIFLKERLRKRTPLPPGPPADPLIGHLRLIPQVGQDVFFYRIGKIYGDVVHLQVLGRSLIILNSVEAATELLDQRSANYSDRPTFPLYGLMGIGEALGFVKYGNEWRIQRKMVQQYFSKEKCKEHRPVEVREARILAQNLLSTPEDRASLVLRFATAVVIDISYGHQIVSNDDPYVTIVEDCCRIAVESGPPGGTPVDLIPILQYFPSWFPGTYYATYARNAFDKFRRLKEYPFAQVKEQMAKGTAKPSFLASQFEALYDGTEDGADTQQIQNASAMLYIAGVETTSATLSFFFLAMVLYPECQVKVQKEIDSVVGFDRLPEFHDRESLPYLECLLQETLRWNNAAPSGGPHKTLEEDVYNGMLIPKGCTVIANTRGMTWDEFVYKDPFSFDPMRFLPTPAGRGEPYPAAAFGFGRRICPGRHLAEDSLWIAIAIIVATMSISKAIGKDGKEVIPDATIVTHGITSHPSAFPCRLEPRSDMAVNLLTQITESG